MNTLPEIVKDIRDNYTGVQGIICQHDRDEGDSLQRVGTYYLLAYYIMDLKIFTTNLNTDLSVLEHPENMYARSADTSKWYGDYRYTSRDQLSIAMAACAGLGVKGHLFKMTKLLFSRIGFHTNIYRNGIPAIEQEPKTPDIMSPDQLGAIIRGFSLYPLYPLLFILDLSMLFMVVYGRTLKPWDSDNMLLSWLVLADMKMPTLVSWIAKKLYSTKVSDVLHRLNEYHSVKNNGIPPLAELQRLAFRKLTYGDK